MAVVSASKVQKNFGAYHDLALSELVRVTKYGRETVVILSAMEFHALKEGQRRSLGAGDLNDAELEAIALTEIPGVERYRLKDIRRKRKR